uniref:Uncharacterized protein n=1 Tax=Callorhinchus milii TaxID=7868 RepID=A0A4W3J7S4_CALMI
MVRKSDESDISDEDEDDEDDNIELLLAEEFAEEEEELEEEDEDEHDATDRLQTEIGEKFEADEEKIESVKENLKEILIPFIGVNGARKPHIVHYKLYNKVKPMVENRLSLFEKCYPISTALARKMANVSYKKLSSFGLWDVVELSEGSAIQPVQDLHKRIYSVLHRKYIYFFSNKQTRDKFIANPFKYLSQSKPKPVVPFKIAVLGPPKSGKSTVARRLANEYGLQRISAGEAVRTVLVTQKKTFLALQINKHLKKGLTVPDELVVQCIEVLLMDILCNTRGYVYNIPQFKC